MASRFIRVKYGYLSRDESMNIGILAWEHDQGNDTPVIQRLIPDWGYILAAFPRWGDELRADVIQRVTAIKTYGDYYRVWERMGPYTPFEFTEPNPSTMSAAQTLEEMWKFFFTERP